MFSVTNGNSLEDGREELCVVYSAGSETSRMLASLLDWEWVF